MYQKSIYTASWTACLLGLTNAFAAPPDVQYLFPAGGQRGETVTVTVGGSLGDKPVRAWCSRSGVTVEPGEQKDSLVVTIAEDVPPGVCWIRLYNDEGAAALRPFIIGTLPEGLEQEPNNDTGTAQVLETSQVVVNGTLDKPGDVDVFAVPLKAGETLVAAMTANEVLGSPMDGLLQVLSPDGFVLEQNDDDQGLDPRIVFTAESDGTYFVRTFAFPAQPNSSVAFAGAPGFVYRLTLTTGPFIDHPFPLAVSEGDSPRVQIRGWNVPDDLRELPVDVTDDEAAVRHPRLANTAAVRVVPHATVSEQQPNGPEQPQPVEWPVTISGRIDEPGDVDAYSFRAAKGDKLVFRAESRSLGAPLDPVLRLMDDEGKLVREVDDSTRGVFDPELAWTAPADGEYRIQITDLHRQGGERYVYRLTVAAERPDYTLTLAADAFVLAPGTPLEIPVTVNRLANYAGEIDISAAGLPDGVSATAVRSVAGDDSAKAVKLVLESTAEAAWSGPVRIIGRTAGEDSQTGRTAEAPIPNLKATTRDVWLTVSAP